MDLNSEGSGDLFETHLSCAESPNHIILSLHEKQVSSYKRWLRTSVYRFQICRHFYDLVKVAKQQKNVVIEVSFQEKTSQVFRNSAVVCISTCYCWHKHLERIVGSERRANHDDDDVNAQ